nr:hypothetical protein [Tanacetum cinerariifolium]
MNNTTVGIEVGPTVRPQPVPTGKPKVHPVPTGKLKFTPVPTGRPHRPFPVATDRGCSPSVPTDGKLLLRPQQVVLGNHIEKVFTGYPRTMVDLVHLHGQNFQIHKADPSHNWYVVPTGRYVVLTGRVIVPASRYIVSAGSVIVATGRYIVPAGRVVHSFYLDDSNICQVFSAINFDCLLNIDEEICPLVVLKFYKSVRITQNIDQTISIAFIIRNLYIVLPLHHTAQILLVSCEGACMYSIEWSIASLPKSIDPNPIYHTPLDDLVLVRDAIFYERASPKRLTKKGEMIVRDPFQIELNEMKLDFKKWETILSENVISLSRNKDYLNACLVYMLFCLSNKKPFNLTYYMAKRMVGVI